MECTKVEISTLEESIIFHKAKYFLSLIFQLNSEAKTLARDIFSQTELTKLSICKHLINSDAKPCDNHSRMYRILDALNFNTSSVYRIKQGPFECAAEFLDKTELSLNLEKFLKNNRSKHHGRILRDNLRLITAFDHCNWSPTVLKDQQHTIGFLQGTGIPYFREKNERKRSLRSHVPHVSVTASSSEINTVIDHVIAAPPTKVNKTHVSSVISTIENTCDNVVDTDQDMESWSPPIEMIQDLIQDIPGFISDNYDLDTSVMFDENSANETAGQDAPMTSSFVPKRALIETEIPNFHEFGDHSYFNRGVGVGGPVLYKPETSNPETEELRNTPGPSLLRPTLSPDRSNPDWFLKLVEDTTLFRPPQEERDKIVMMVNVSRTSSRGNPRAGMKRGRPGKNTTDPPPSKKPTSSAGASEASGTSGTSGTHVIAPNTGPPMVILKDYEEEVNPPPLIPDTVIESEKEKNTSRGELDILDNLDIDMNTPPPPYPILPVPSDNDKTHVMTTKPGDFRIHVSSRDPRARKMEGILPPDILGGAGPSSGHFGAPNDSMVLHDVNRQAGNLIIPTPPDIGSIKNDVETIVVGDDTELENVEHPYSWSSYTKVYSSCQDGIVLGYNGEHDNQSLVSRFNPIAVSLQERALCSNPALDFYTRGVSDMTQFFNCPDHLPPINYLRRFINSELRPWAPNAFYLVHLMKVMDIYIETHNLRIIDNQSIIRVNKALMPVVNKSFVTTRQLVASILRFCTSADTRVILSSKLEIDESTYMDGRKLSESTLETEICFKTHILHYLKNNHCRLPPKKLSYREAVEYMTEIVLKHPNIKPLIDNGMIFTFENDDQLFDFFRVKMFTLKDLLWITYRCVNIVAKCQFARRSFNEEFEDKYTQKQLQKLREDQTSDWTDEQKLAQAADRCRERLAHFGSSSGMQSRYASPKLQQKLDREIGVSYSQSYVVRNENDGTVSQSQHEIAVKKYTSNFNGKNVPGFDHPPPAPYASGHTSDTLRMIKIGKDNNDG